MTTRGQYPVHLSEVSVRCVSNISLFLRSQWRNLIPSYSQYTTIMIWDAARDLS